MKLTKRQKKEVIERIFDNQMIGDNDCQATLSFMLNILTKSQIDLLLSALIKHYPCAYDEALQYCGIV